MVFANGLVYAPAAAAPATSSATKAAAVDGPASAPNTARLVRQHRFDSGPFEIAEFMTHNPRLRFRSLNHVYCSTINSRGAISPQYPSPSRRRF